MSVLAYIPSPTTGAIHLGPLTIRAYALCIIIGIVIAIWLGNKRIIARGGKAGQMIDIAIWAVPFGIVGGRIYHVFTTPEPYFGQNGHLIDALKIWNGGLGIWGAIALGAVGAYIGCRQLGLRLPVVADALAPGIVLAQAAGRVGNYFNNELYGARTDLPWALKIHEWDLAAGEAVRDSSGKPVVLGYFQPTFLYELIWNVLVAGLVIWADKKFRLGRGRAFALYVAAYCLGRLIVEKLRTDEAEIIFGQRLNVWTAIIIGLGAVAYMIIRRGPREASIYRDGREPEPTDAPAANEPVGDSEQVDDTTSETAAEAGEPDKPRAGPPT